MVLASTKKADEVITDVEKTIEHTKEIPSDSEGIKKQQAVYQVLQHLLSLIYLQKIII